MAGNLRNLKITGKILKYEGMQAVILPEKQRSPWERATTATAMTTIMTRTMMTMAMIGPDPASTKRKIHL